ncbi:MAG: RagB/SusD family nutrient uptake outer membrane protein [Tannerella sp.]|jgi:hypothetical protein|nr:RagB/SusD family nutrient uptake outer membrane protein [Tannerella sp.]
MSFKWVTINFWAEGEAKAGEVSRFDGGSDGSESTVGEMQVTWNDVLQPVFPSGPGFDPCVDWMLEERAHELYGEMNRWEDLVRTGTLVARVRLYNPDAKNNIREHHKLRPVPNSHIDRLSPKPPMSEAQNPGYY